MLRVSVSNAVTLCTMSNYLSISDDNIYRVSIDPDTKLVEMVSLGMFNVDPQLEGFYDDVDDLPVWAQEKLSVLMLCDAVPPTQEIDGVGKRISTHVYWLYKLEMENYYHN